MSGRLVSAVFLYACLILVNAEFLQDCYQTNKVSPTESDLLSCGPMSDRYENVGCGLVRYFSDKGDWEQYLRMCAPSGWDGAFMNTCTTTTVPGSKLKVTKCVCTKEGCNRDMASVTASFQTETN